MVEKVSVILTEGRKHDSTLALSLTEPPASTMFGTSGRAAVWPAGTRLQADCRLISDREGGDLVAVKGEEEA